MNSFEKEIQDIVKQIDLKISQFDRELALVEEDVADDLEVMMICKLNRSIDKLSDLVFYKDYLVTLKKVLLERAKQELVDLRNQLMFILEANAI